MSHSPIDLLIPRREGWPDEPLVATVASREDLGPVEGALGNAVADGRGGLVFAPRRMRRSVAASLSSVPDAEVIRYLVLPNAGSPAFVVPLEDGPLRYVSSQAAPAWADRLGAALVPRLGPCLYRVAPSAGVAVYARTADPFAWLSEHTPAPVRHVVLRPSWRGGEGAVVIVGFPEAGSEPIVIAKAARGDRSAQALHREAGSLADLGPDAEAAGARVPHVRAIVTRDGAPVLLMSPVEGASAALLVASGRARATDVLDRIARWLGRWHQATRTTDRLDADRLGAWIERPLRRLSAVLPNGYAARVRALAEGVAEHEVPLVAAHRDLTMRNVLLGGDRPLGVVDWEEAVPLALPLTDWFYAAVDLVHTAHGGTRAEAARAALGVGGRFTEIVRAGAGNLADGIGLPPEAAALAGHATWLHHAANEADAVGPGAATPFLDVVRWVAGQPDWAL